MNEYKNNTLLIYFYFIAPHVSINYNMYTHIYIYIYILFSNYNMCTPDHIVYSPLNSYVYIHWILDFIYILLLCTHIYISIAIKIQSLLVRE